MFLHKNNLNYNSHIYSYKSPFIPFLSFLTRDDTHITSMKIFRFQDNPLPFSNYVQNSPWPWTSDFKEAPPSPNNNQSVKRKNNPRMTIMLSGLSFRSTFVYNINSLVFSGFPFTSFHLAEASLVPIAILKN